MSRAPELSISGVVNGAGRLTITVTPSGRQRWTVDQVAVEMTTAPGAATADLRKNGNLVTPLVPQQDSAGGDPAVMLNAGDKLTVNWASCTPGDVGRVTIFYDDGTP